MVATGLTLRGVTVKSRGWSFLSWSANHLWKGESKSAKGMVGICSSTSAEWGPESGRISGLRSETAGDLSQQESLV